MHGTFDKFEKRPAVIIRDRVWGTLEIIDGNFTGGGPDYVVVIIVFRRRAGDLFNSSRVRAVFRRE